MRIGLIAIIAACLAAGACSPERLPTVPEPAPSPSSPEQALRLLEWSWNRRDLARYTDLLAADFVFVCGALDPYGNAYPDRSWGRGDEVIMVRNLFAGSENMGAPLALTLALDPVLRVSSDPRPGRNERWHKVVRSTLSLTLIDADQVRRDVGGNALFYLVRGDSVALGQEQIDGGIHPDSTVWYLERWEDESATGGGMRTLPSKLSTMCGVKATYR